MLTEVGICRIYPNPKNPRKNFDEIALQELAASIKQLGILQPLVVVHGDGDRYRLVAGERRWKAAQIAALDTVPVIIKELTPQQEAEAMLIENLQRKDLDPIDEARGMEAMIKECGWTQEQLAEKLGCTQGHIANRLRLLELPETVQKNISQEIITPTHARALVRLSKIESGTAGIESISKDIEQRGMTVKQTEEAVDRWIKDHCNPLFKTDNYFFRDRSPSFETKSCKDCEHVIRAQYQGNLQRFCSNDKCWQKKQAEGKKIREQEEQERLAKEAARGIINLEKIGYGNFQEIDTYDFRDIAKQECLGCQEIKIGKWYGQEKQVCLNMKCVRSKKLKITKEKNAAARSKIREEVDQAAEFATKITVAGMQKNLLVYIAGLIISSIEVDYNREIKRNDLLRDYLGWDKEVVKKIGSAYSSGMREHYWKEVVSQLSHMNQDELFKIIIQWPIMAAGFKVSYNQWLQRCYQESECQ